MAVSYIHYDKIFMLDTLTCSVSFNLLHKNRTIGFWLFKIFTDCPEAMFENLLQAFSDHFQCLWRFKNSWSCNKNSFVLCLRHGWFSTCFRLPWGVLGIRKIFIFTYGRAAVMPRNWHTKYINDLQTIGKYWTGGWNILTSLYHFCT